MSVILETSQGDITIDLFVEECPLTCKNFLKLCKIKYYNNCLFHNIQKDFIIQTGDPTNTGKGGESIYGILYGEQAKYFEDEIRPSIRHNKIGMVGMASAGPNLNASQFYITSSGSSSLSRLDEVHTLFGEIAEGLETVSKINDLMTDSNGRPLQVIRIRHTIILEDPFEDPVGLEVPPQSPLPPEGQWSDLIGEEEAEKILNRKDSNDDDGNSLEIEEKLQKELRAKEAKSREDVLEIIGDIPEAGVRPPDNVLFVCKLNPVTTSEDLEIIFSRFGDIKKCEVIKDWKTGDSLSYAFIEFVDAKSCEDAYFKMDNVLIDDRRIHVDFSQSVSKQAIGKDGRLIHNFARNQIRMGASAGGRSVLPAGLEWKNSSHPNHNDKYPMVFEEEGTEKKRESSSSSFVDKWSDRKRPRDNSADHTDRHRNTGSTLERIDRHNDRNSKHRHSKDHSPRRKSEEHKHTGRPNDRSRKSHSDQKEK